MSQQTKRPKSIINGYLIIDKPYGISSNRVLSQIKRYYQPQKVGFLGTLDPMATGVLVICFGWCTKMVDYLHTKEKTYQARVEFGAKTASLDKESPIIDTCPLPSVQKETCLDILSRLTGTIEQEIPAYSACKYKGQARYRYARENIAITPKSKKVVINEIDLLNLHYDDHEAVLLSSMEIQVRCQSGTYIRMLAEQIASLCDTYGYLSALRRTDSLGGLNVAMYTLEDLEQAFEEKTLENLLIAPDMLLEDMPKWVLDVHHYEALKQGKQVSLPLQVDGLWLRIYDKEKFVGVLRIEEGQIVRRMWLKPAA